MKEIIAQYRPQIIPALEKFLFSRRVRTRWGSDVPQRMFTFCCGGKFVRGSLFLAGYHALGGTQEVTPVAVSLSLMQSALLAHDDIIDKDDFRRGNPSIHKQYESFGLGEELAIVFGDLGIFWGIESLASLDTDKERVVKAIQAFSSELSLVGYGEMEDTFLAVSSEEPTVDEILEVLSLKTGRYTIYSPLLLACILNGVEDPVLEEFCDIVGTLYQLRDDELGMFSDSVSVGKSVGGDIKENKRTVLRALLCKADPVFVREQFGKKKVDIFLVRERMHTSGAFEEYLALRISLEKKAALLIPQLHPQLQELCSSLLSFVSSRKK